MRRYILNDVIGKGGMGVVYHATDRLTGNDVALKKIATTADDDYRLALAREFRTLAGLRHPQIVSVLDYGFEGDAPYFTMQLLEGAQPVTREHIPLGEETKVTILLQILSALTYLHRRRVMHRDLKPANVLLLPGGDVKVVDFGLALTGPGEAVQRGIPGTPAYMAPELINGQQATPASDLYALGIMAYEMFAGGHPYDTSSLMTLYRDLSRKMPDLEPVPKELRPIVGRLLAKEVADRYSTAEEVVAALYRAIGREMPPENEAQRESFLQASAFVGRDEEFERLTAALDALRAGEGGLWLVGGESGIGKSRLVDELRIHALVEGVMAVRGQGVQGASHAYDFWRGALRPLVLEAELTDATASILKDIIPDIGGLLGRPIPSAPPLEGAPGQQRLSQAVVSLLAAQGPTLLILEDLQWAQESLDLLKLVAAAEMPIMIVGTYRTEERPNLPETFDEAKVIMLERLSPERIAALTQAMMGRIDGDVVQFIHEQTEGNILFMVEVLRALAEEAGRLDAIPMMTLPEYLMAGGMLTVLQRRLARIAPEHQQALRLAAVTGRWLDVALLAYFTDDVQGFLQAGAAAAVFDVQENRWRFTHDKLREAVLIDLDDQRDLHRRVAEAIEVTYPAEPDYAPTLAEHWHAAGHAEKEAHYARQAAVQYQKVSNFREMKRFAEQALKANRHDAELTRLLATAQFHLGNYDAAQEGFNRLQELAPDQTAEALLGIGRVHRYRREDDAARATLKHALEAFRARADQPGMAHALYNLGVINILGTRKERGREQMEEALAIFTEEGLLDLVGHARVALGVYHQHQGEMAEARRFYQAGLDLHRELGNLLGETIALENLGIVEDLTGNHAEAERCYRDVLALSIRIGDRYGVGSASRNLAVVLRRQGRYAEGKDAALTALEIDEAFNNKWGMGLSVNNLALMALAQGDLEQAETMTLRAMALFEEAGDERRLGSSCGVLAEVRAQQGHKAEALALLHRMLVLEGGETQATWGSLLNAAWVYYHLGEHERAAEIAGLLAAQREKLGGDALVQLPDLLNAVAERQAALLRGAGFSKWGTVRSLLGATAVWARRIEKV